MKRIEVKLALPVVAPLLDVIRGLVDGLRQRLVVTPQVGEGDAELGEAWAAELLAAQGAEVATLLALFDDDFFADGVVAFDEANAEAILRACSAIRLRLRETALKSLGDDVLETGDVDITRVVEPVRRAFVCYLFLATLQELLIEHFGESVLGK